MEKLKSLLSISHMYINALVITDYFEAKSKSRPQPQRVTHSSQKGKEKQGMSHKPPGLSKKGCVK